MKTAVKCIWGTIVVMVFCCVTAVTAIILLPLSNSSVKATSDGIVILDQAEDFSLNHLNNGVVTCYISAAGQTKMVDAIDVRIVIPDSVTAISSGAFKEYDKLTSVKLPDGVTSIGEKAFADCSNLTTVELPDSLTTIGRRAFYCCEKLTNITIPDRVTAIGEEAFVNCDSLTSVTIPDGVTTIEDLTFWSCDKLSSVTIPNSVTSIGKSAFYWTNLTKITIPNSVTSIGQGAFSCCFKLTSVEFPAGLTEIGTDVFGDCKNLVAVICPDQATVANYKNNFAVQLSNQPLTYLVELRIKLTSGDIYVTKAFAGDGEKFGEYFYENGTWVQNANQLPTLPDGSVLSAESGQVLTAEMLREMINTTENGVVDIGFTTQLVATPTAGQNILTYTTTEQEYLPDGFDPKTMTIANNRQTNVGTYTVTVNTIGGYAFVGGKTTVTFTFTIEPAVINQPTAGENTVNYNGEAHTYYPDGFDPKTMTISNNQQTNAETYTVTVTTKSGYTFADEETTVKFTFTIERAVIDAPTAGENTVNYNGEARTYYPDGFDSKTMNITKNNWEADYVGSYPVTITAKNNYVFNNGETSVTFRFTIERTVIATPKWDINKIVYGKPETYKPSAFDEKTMIFEIQSTADTLKLEVRAKLGYVFDNGYDTLSYSIDDFAAAADNAAKKAAGKIDMAVIIGSVVAGVVALGGIATVTTILTKRRRRQK